MGKSSIQQAEPLQTSVSRAGKSNRNVEHGQMPLLNRCMLCMFQAKQNTSHHNAHTAGFEGVLSATQEIAIHPGHMHVCTCIACLQN